jgi:hypothetical protein
MKQLGLQGIRRGAKQRTTINNGARQRPLDLINRQVAAIWPNQLWVADSIFAATWDRLCLRGFYHRCLCPLYRGLACPPVPFSVNVVPGTRKLSTNVVPKKTDVIGFCDLCYRAQLVLDLEGGEHAGVDMIRHVAVVEPFTRVIGHHVGADHAPGK